ncbi:hypothetical protein TL16_g06715 [Triparma laevis f. inornata]|uniref:Pantoate--beta-alanine ligase n=1 Tax=Triparma laevis f. inornata TaxID=1714386 RepID=A0A9W7ARG4_9STRA|nr:hypothetical protein TL16_g06715 [Triparma laevis f. inornata]
MSAMASSRFDVLIQRSVKAFRSKRLALPPNSSVGFVPTMGALHEGHLSLVKEAKAKNDIVISSIFVNPTQFGPNEDLDRYPQQLQEDASMLEDLGVDLIFAPDRDEMYLENHTTFVTPEVFEMTAEGKARPGFFTGVATVVTKLFNVVQPTNAYFGQKDAVQCCVIKRIVKDLNIPTNVVIMPTVRESDGLAMSSRNAYLTVEERSVAPVVFKSLLAGEQVWLDGGRVANKEQIVAEVERVLKEEPMMTEIEYVSVDSNINMLPIDSVDADGCCLSLAVKCGEVRLIDNIVFGVAR